MAQKCSKYAPTGVRNRALIIVLHCGALRVSEALALTPSDVDCTRGLITVDGDAPRVVHIESGPADHIGRWMRVRAERGLRCDLLFCTLRETPVAQAYVRQFLPKLARKAGIDKPVHALALRDAHAAVLIADGIKPQALQELLGFKSIASTIRYMNEIRSRP
jgi:integrase/recombinase XerD